MTQFVQLAFDGTVIGILYAMVGLGIVIVFRTTNVLNFTQGAVATLAGYIAFWVTDAFALPYGVALAVALAVGAVAGVLVGTLMTLGLAHLSFFERSVATLGLFLLIGWLIRVVFGELGRNLPRPFAGTTEFFGVAVGRHGVFVAVVALVGIGATFWLMERTRLGLAMRALALDEETARENGVSLRWTSLAAWAIASALGAVSGVLVGSFIQVDHSIMVIILIQSIMALILGGFGTATGAVVGGIVLGISSSLIAGYASPSYKNTFVFGLVLLMLIIRPTGLLGKANLKVHESGHEEDHPPLPRPGTWRSPSRVGTTLIVGALLVAVPFLPHPLSLVTYAVTLAVAVVVISLGFMMGFIGEISLGHGAVVTIGAYTTAILGAHTDLDYLVVLLLSGLVAGAVGAALGLVTIRLSGLYLSLATLALIFVVVEMALQLRDLTGGAAGISIPSPTVFGVELSGDRAKYYLALTVLGLVVGGLAWLMRSAHGQRWVAVRDAPVAAASSGVAVRTYKVLGFALSSAVAGLAGSVIAVVVTFVSPHDYGLFFSIYLILAVVLGGAGSATGALLGAAFISMLPVALSRTSGLTDAIFGVALIGALAFIPGGVRGVITRRAARGRRRTQISSDPNPELVDARRP